MVQQQQPPMQAGNPVPEQWRQHVSQVLIGTDDIVRRNVELGFEISKLYQGKNPILIGVLKGSIIFLSDLSRQLAIEHEIHFIQAQSYTGTKSSGKVNVMGLNHINLKDRHVILIEDIIDTGLTLKSIVEQLKDLKPTSLKICTFISKHTQRRLPDSPHVDFVAHYIPDKFVVGYGLDVNQRFRHLPFLGVYEKAT